MTPYPAKVVELDDHGPIVVVPMLGGAETWGPLASSVPDLAVGDQVVVMPLGTSADRLHVLARLQSRRPLLSEITGLVDRLDDIDAKDAAQDARLTGLDTLTGQHTTTLGTLASRAGTLETRAGAIETVNTTQNGRLDAVEARNTAQDASISTNATNIAANGTRITDLNNATLHRTGDESKTGVLTLGDEPVIPTATKATSPVRADDPRVNGRTANVRLVTANNANVPYTAANGDLYAQSNWTAIDDAFNMFRMLGGYATLTPGLDGFWWIIYRTLFVISSNASDPGVAFVVKNSRSPANSVARDSRRYVGSGNDGTPVLALNRVRLAATDVLYWGNWSPVNSAIIPGVPGLNSYTEITVTYDGPG